MEKMVLMTVNGPIDPAQAGVTDAHNHVWISQVAGSAYKGPILDDKETIIAELIDYQMVGGRTIIDCQPGGCGRDGNMLRELANQSGVNIVASTGCHLRKYYPENYWLFGATVDAAREYFKHEFEFGLVETMENQSPVKAGVLKIACEATLDQSPLSLLEAAVETSLEKSVAIEVHTERGIITEQIVQLLFEYGLSSEKLILCHVDKRADFALHSSLAQEGILLEYDTFFRPKYQPEQNVWPLLEKMVEAGFETHVAIATDAAEASMWARLGGRPGLAGLITEVIPRLTLMGCEQKTINMLTGGNIASRLAYPDQHLMN